MHLIWHYIHLLTILINSKCIQPSLKEIVWHILNQSDKLASFRFHPFKNHLMCRAQTAILTKWCSSFPRVSIEYFFLFLILFRI